MYERFGSTIPPVLSGVMYTSTAAGGATGNTQGQDAIIDTLTLPAGGQVTYTLIGTVSLTATGLLQLAAAVYPQAWFDANSANNNVAGDSNPIVAPQPRALTFSATTYTVTETGTTATITISRVGGLDGAITVRYRTADGTATAGADYETAVGTKTWADGDSSRRRSRSQSPTTPWSSERDDQPVAVRPGPRGRPFGDV